MKRYQIFKDAESLNPGGIFFVNRFGYLVEEMSADSVPAADAITVVSGYNEARTWRPSTEEFRRDSPVFALFKKSAIRKLAGYGPRMVGGVVVVPVRDKKHGRIIAKNRNVWAFGFADGSQPLSEFLAKFSK